MNLPKLVFSFYISVTLSSATSTYKSTFKKQNCPYTWIITSKTTELGCLFNKIIYFFKQYFLPKMFFCAFRNKLYVHQLKDNCAKGKKYFKDFVSLFSVNKVSCLTSINGNLLIAIS